MSEVVAPVTKRTIESVTLCEVIRESIEFWDTHYVNLALLTWGQVPCLEQFKEVRVS